MAGLATSFGSGAMTNSIECVEKAKAILVIGSNTTETHPVISTFLKQAVRGNGARLIVADPRQTEMTGFAELWLRHQPGTDTALALAMYLPQAPRGRQIWGRPAAMRHDYESCSSSGRRTLRCPS